MIFVDTGYFIALAVESDELHPRAIRWAAVNCRLLISEYVVVEAVNHLSRVGDRPKAHPLLTYAMSDQGCEFVRAAPDLFDASVNLHRSRPDKTWSLTDCISFCLMRDRGVREALAYDEHFEQAGFVALLRKEP